MSARIHATAIVDPGAELAEDVEVGPYSIVGADVSIGARTRLASHVVVEGPTTVGEDCDIHAFVVLGGPPQHLAYRGEPTRLEIGPRNVIREGATMHRGTPQGRGVTIVGSDGFYMAQSHVGHDCVVGDRVVLAHGGTLGGHVTVGEQAVIGGLAAVHQYSRIGRHANIGGLAGVNRDIIPYGSAYGNPAHLEGLNLIGLKRRNFDRETINKLRAAYRMLFAEEGTFKERLDDASEMYSEMPEVAEIVEFIRMDGSRPLCLPHRED